MLAKAASFSPDAFVPDMEDSVAWNDKSQARETVSANLEMLANTGKKVIPRINSLDTGLCEADLAAIVGPHIYGVSVGKIDTPADVTIISDTIAGLETERGITNGCTKLVLWIETAVGILNAHEILSSDARIKAAAFGAEDFTNDMGIERNEDDREILFPRSQVAIAARAAGVLALDTPFFGFRDPDNLKIDSEQSKAIGFKGKFAIHPLQIDIINHCFSPSSEEIAHAMEVIKVFEEAAEKGRGSTSLNGQVVDVPVVKRAKSLLNQAKQMEIIS
ncbi:MAG: citrate lyase subunit beta / citryl-CoA lyase [Chloroflexi bacterium]|jgi:citrate lyase subunit beta/citryl-CoA lyase|nr:MAG: citrate lyase subunit beta / citryl-CoA lyase [Chloroflexota bacterium]